MIATAMSVCKAFFRGSDIYVVASAKTVHGIYQDSEPFFKLSQPVSSQELGQTVLQALASYREKVPGKTFIRGVKQPPDPFLTFAGFKSWGAFERGARHFSISSKGTEVEIMPSVPGEQGGYLHQPARAVRCHGQPEQIGGCLLAQADSNAATS